MRIASGFCAGELRGIDDDAARPRRRGDELVHPRIVVGAVEDDDLRIGDLPHDAGRRLEQMWVLVRIVHDADNVDPVAAELARDVAVEIFRRHHRDLAVGGARGWGRAQRQRKGEDKAGNGFHHENTGLAPDGPQVCNNITYHWQVLPDW